MKKYNISKYDPAFKDNNRKCFEEEWTAISDVGKTFDGKIFTAEEYVSMEDSYIKALQTILSYFKIEYLYVSDVRKSFEDKQFLELRNQRKVQYTSDILEMYDVVEKTKKIKCKNLDPFLRLLLREDIGAKVYCPRKLKVFICYDYLMGIHSSRSITEIIPKIEALGLFVEEAL